MKFIRAIFFLFFLSRINRRRETSFYSLFVFKENFSLFMNFGAHVTVHFKNERGNYYRNKVTGFDHIRSSSDDVRNFSFKVGRTEVSFPIISRDENTKVRACQRGEKFTIFGISVPLQTSFLLSSPTFIISRNHKVDVSNVQRPTRDSYFFEIPIHPSQKKSDRNPSTFLST